MTSVRVREKSLRGQSEYMEGQHEPAKHFSLDLTECFWDRSHSASVEPRS